MLCQPTEPYTSSFPTLAVWMGRFPNLAGSLPFFCTLGLPCYTFYAILLDMGLVKPLFTIVLQFGQEEPFSSPPFPSFVPSSLRSFLGGTTHHVCLFFFFMPTPILPTTFPGGLENPSLFVICQLVVLLLEERKEGGS